MLNILCFTGMARPITSELTLNFVFKGIVTSLKLISDDMWAKVGDQLPSIKVLSFAIGIVHGMLSSRQIVGTAGKFYK